MPGSLTTPEYPASSFSTFPFDVITCQFSNLLSLDASSLKNSLNDAAVEITFVPSIKYASSEYLVLSNFHN
ncbi:UNVERIFIED_CONTAM: hypothetical protein O8I53_06550 [Campylobacter lari]